MVAQKKSDPKQDPTQDPAFKRVVRHFLTKKPEHKAAKGEKLKGAQRPNGQKK